ncbi:MAG TPA: hypothetical protein ENK57_21960 [Polyangiaceae bacterium]|nr:hypothetical protein [Polyangiaceae bacterium]
MRIARPSDGMRSVTSAYQLGHPPVFSEVLVGNDEVVVFRRLGVVLGTLGAGVHTLSPTVTPFLESAKSTDQRRYECEVIFIRTTGTRLALDGSIGRLTDVSGQEAEFFLMGVATLGTTSPADVVTRGIGMGRAGDGVDAIARQRLMATLGPHLRAVFEQGRASPTQLPQVGPAVLAAGKADELGLAALGLDVRELEITRLVSPQNRPPAGREAAERRAEVASAADLPTDVSCRFGAARVPFWDTVYEMMVHVSVVGYFVGERVSSSHEQWVKDAIKQSIVRTASSWTGTVLDLPGKKDEWGRYVSESLAADLSARAKVRGRVVIEGVQLDAQEEGELRRRRGARLMGR